MSRTSVLIIKLFTWLLLTYSLTLCSRVPLHKLTGFQPVKKYPAFYGTRKFNITFTTVHLLRHLDPVHASHPTSWSSILILYTHLRLGLPSGLSLSFRFPHQNPVYASALPIRATCPAHLILFDFVTRTIYGEQERSLAGPSGRAV